MAKYECEICGYIFDEEQAGENFENIFSCPICDADKDKLKMIEGDAKEEKSEEDSAADDFSFEEADEETLTNEISNDFAKEDTVVRDLGEESSFVRSFDKEDSFETQNVYEKENEAEPIMTNESEETTLDFIDEILSENKEEAAEGVKEENAVGGFVIEKRQEFWKKEDDEIKEESHQPENTTSLNHFGSVQKVIGENADTYEASVNVEKPAENEHNNGLIQTFYYGAKPVKTEEELKAEEEAKNKENQEFKPFFGNGMGTIQKVVGEDNTFEEKPEESTKVISEEENEESNEAYVSEEKSEESYEAVFEEKNEETNGTVEEETTEKKNEFSTDAFAAWLEDQNREDNDIVSNDSDAVDAVSNDIEFENNAEEQNDELKIFDSMEEEVEDIEQNDNFETNEVEPKEIEPNEIEPNEIEPVDIEPADINPAEVETMIVEPTEIEPEEINMDSFGDNVFEDGEEFVFEEAEDDAGFIAFAGNEQINEISNEESDTLTAAEEFGETSFEEEIGEDTINELFEDKDETFVTENVTNDSEETEQIPATETASTPFESFEEADGINDSDLFEKQEEIIADETAKAEPENLQFTETSFEEQNEPSFTFPGAVFASFEPENKVEEDFALNEENVDDEPAGEPGADVELIDEVPAEESGADIELFDETPAEEPGADVELIDEAPAEEPVEDVEMFEETPSEDELFENNEENVSEEVTDVSEEGFIEDEEREYISLDEKDAEEIPEAPIAYSMLKSDTKYTVLYDSEAQKIFEDYPALDENISNGLENIILLPAQCNPLPLKRNAEVDTKTVIGALTECPVEVLQPFCFSKLFIWGEHIPNNSKPEEYANQALVLVKGEEGHIPNLSSKEELREEVAIAKARFHNAPVGIDLVAGRIEADLEACVYAKVDYVILNDVSSRILPYALRRARNYLNRVNSKLEILVCVEALKDAQELAKILALGANFVLVERGFDLEMANKMTEALKEICRSTGHNNVHDLNLEDICTIDMDIAMYTDISHV